MKEKDQIGLGCGEGPEGEAAGVDRGKMPRLHQTDWGRKGLLAGGRRLDV